MDKRLLLIGQAPGPNTDPAEPLPTEPKTGTLGRLCHFIDIDPEEFVAFVQRVNLLQYHPGRWRRDDVFPRREARIAARAVLPLIQGRNVVMLGRNVSQAFGVPELMPFHKWVDCDHLGVFFSVVPHPSGRNHWYNSPTRREECREFWSRCLGVYDAQDWPRLANRYQNGSAATSLNY